MTTKLPLAFSSELATALPKQERSRRTREKLIQAAAQLFEERGFEKTTSNDIAAAAGVSIGSFYAYFSDKRQVLLLLFEQRLAERLDAVFSNFTEDDLTGDDLRGCIERCIYRTFANKAEAPGLTRLIYDMASKDEAVGLLCRRLMDDSVQNLAKLLRKAVTLKLTQLTDPWVTATTIVYAVEAVARKCVLEDELPEPAWKPYITCLTDMTYGFVFGARPSPVSGGPLTSLANPETKPT
ncbi:MAG: TetR/AcrR family transcriptional regulator [Chloracidobacterium sp.]|nr:TetR/AcrR family transcriptional regulator [Chloracidobacterium sp.]MDW8216271.1 TetR/AcrR family transcriptional regulator [Acidobacteriota bacterium]